MKLLLRESDWEQSRDILGDADYRRTSRLTYVESRAALAAATRAGRVSPRALARAKRELEERWPAFDVIELTESISMAAGDVAEAYRLRGSDAIHLTSALLFEDPTILVATWDTGLRQAALEAGLAVAP